MSPRTRLQLHALAGVGLLGMSVTAWWGLGPTGSDLLLAHAPSEALQTLPALARQLLEFSLSWAGPLGLDASMAWNLLRLENSLWVLLAGWICALLLARTVAPWLGAEAAHAVLRTGLLVLPVSGFSILQGAHVLARGEILALLFSLACALAYLRARQDSRRGAMLLAALFAVLAGAAGHASFALPFLVAVLEWLSARRHRGAGRQLAASATALIVFATLRFGAARLSGESLVLEGGAGESLARGLAVLGRSLAPLDLRVDLPRALASGVLVLAALQPLLIAARSAPRTWGRFSLAWIVVMAAVLAGSLLVPPAQRPQPWYLELLVPGLLVSAGLCIAVSARGGWRRAGLPWALAFVGLWIAQPLVRAPLEDRAALEALRARVAGDSARAPQARRVLTGWEQQPFALAGFSRERREALLREFCGGTAALDCLSSVDLQRWAGMELFPADVLWIPMAGPTRRLQRATSSERLFWRESARSPQVLDLDPRLHHAVRIVSRAGTPTERAPVLYFRAEGEDQPAAVTGLWIPGSEPAVAWFDMSGDPRWMLAERIRRIWSEGDLNQVTSAEILRQLPATRELPAVPGEQWFWVAWDGEARRGLEVGLTGAGVGLPPTPPGGEAWLERRAGGILLGREKL